MKRNNFVKAHRRLMTKADPILKVMMSKIIQVINVQRSCAYQQASTRGTVQHGRQRTNGHKVRNFNLGQ